MAGLGEATPATRARAWQVTVSPVRDASGKVCGVLAVGQDVTGHRQARERLALVNEASARIGATLDMGTTAGELAEVAVPWKPALNAFAITFSDRFPAAETY
jgi:transcriptional regulator of acetoin/glycerol metabolism